MKQSPLACAVAILMMSSANTTMAESLKDVVQEVMKTNPDVLIEKTEQSAREHVVKQSHAGWLPRIDVSAGQGYESSDNSSTNGDDSLWREEASAKLTQNLFTGMQTTNEIKRTQSRVDAQAQQVSATIENVTLSAAERYINLIRQQTLLTLAERNLKSHQTIQDQISLRMKSGVGRKSALDQTNGRTALAESNLIAEENNYSDALANFVFVVGRGPNGELEDVPTFEDILPATKNDATDLALLNNPQLKSANADVQQAIYQCKTAKGEFSPKFTFELERTWNNDIDGVDNINEDFIAAIRMNYNLYNGGRDLNRVRETHELVNQAKSIRDRTHRQVIESVGLSWNSYNASNRQLDFLTAHKDAMTKTQTAYRKQFNIGQRTLLDLLDTENELFESERAYTDSLYDRIFAQYRILAVAGELYSALTKEKEELIAPELSLDNTDVETLEKVIENAPVVVVDDVVKEEKPVEIDDDAELMRRLKETGAVVRETDI